MANRADLLQAAMRSPNNFRYGQLKALAEAFGWHFERKRGSHEIFRNDSPHLANLPERKLVLQSQNGQAKPYQISQLLKAIAIIQEATKDGT